MKYVSIVVALIALTISSSCISQQKCFDKYPIKELEADTSFVDREEQLILPTFHVQTPPLHYVTPWILKELLRDTVIVYRQADSEISVHAVQDSFFVQCQVDSMQHVIDSMRINVNMKDMVVNNFLQVFHNQRLENQKLKIELKETTNLAQAEKWKHIGVALKYLLILSVALLALFFLVKYTARWD